MDKSYLLGLGFDCDDGHLRITRGKNFRLYGGSQRTHELMQEKVIKFNEVLDKKGKTLDKISLKEFIDIAHKIESKIPKQNNQDRKIKGLRGGT